MAYPQVIIPPSVKPVSPLELAPADDLTVPFQPRFARGTTQRQTWGDPIWSAQVRFESLSGADRALLKAAIAGARGGASNILMTPGIPLRGSFPTTELFTNNDFSNGTTGYQTSANWSLAVSDRVMRLTRLRGGVEIDVVSSSASTVTRYAPYAGRIFVAGAQNLSVMSGGLYLSSSAVNASDAATPATAGLKKASIVADATTASLYFYDSAASTAVAGAYADVSYMSLSRCILADGGPNALTYSDQIDNAAWTKGGTTVTANNHTAPDGTTTAEKITEDTSTGVHYVYQNTGTRTNQADDLCAYGVFAASVLDRDVRLVVSGDSSFTNYAEVTLDVSAGTIGSTSVTGSATNARAFVKSMGNGYYAVWIVARMPAGTAVAMQVNLVSGGTNSYTGTTGAIAAWRLGACVSGVPVKLTQSTSAAISASSQTGSSIYVKGLPASTSGLLLSDDFVEINGELMQVTSSLDSDAAGLGVLQIHRRPTTAIADNTPIIVNNPFGTFRLASDPRITERFGVYTDVDLQLIEALP